MKIVKKDRLLVILGQTATGKSDLAVKIAKKYNGEIISADSRQVYKGLNIGTGKLTRKEMRGVHHWMIDVISPKKTFSVTDWKKMAEERIEVILKKHKLPIICGGTGFYIQSIVDNIVLPEVPPNKKLRGELEKKSALELFNILEKVDSNRAKNIDKHNKVRLIRAIEIAKAMGKIPKLKKNRVTFDVLQIGLKSENLSENIHKRLIRRLKKGMITEATRLHKNGLSFKRMRELGLEYKYLADLLEKKITKKDFMKKLEADIWRYSKRQMTWFKRDKRIEWFDPSEIKRINRLIKKFLVA